ncbi:MAG TPA: sensor domain-containing diguanylate cyclase [Thermodesulfobacteriota bacterium]
MSVPPVAPPRLPELASINEIGKALTSTLDLDEVLRLIMTKISEHLRPENWSLLLVDDEGRELSFVIAVGPGSEGLKGITLKVGEGVAGWVAANGEPLVIPDVSLDPRFSKRVDSLSGFRTESIICVPLKARGRVLGVIELINHFPSGDRKGPPTESSLGLALEDDTAMLVLTTLADFAAIAIENARIHRKLEELTIQDDATRLFNVRHLHRFLDYELARARQYGSTIALIFFDLDHFKSVNDLNDHLAGTKILREVAEIVLRTIRKVDVAVRYGGDEFLVVLPETPKESAVLAAERIRSAIERTSFLQEEGLGLRITASFGVAAFPDDAREKMELLRAADRAMYTVKRAGRNGVARA